MLYYQTTLGKLYCADNIEVLSKIIAAESIDYILSDYPFNCQDGRTDYVNYIKTLSTLYYHVLKKDCVLTIINNPPNIWKTKDCYNLFTYRESIALIRRGSLRPAWHFGFQHNYLINFIKGNNYKKKWNGPTKNHDKTFLTDVIEYQNGYKNKIGFHPQAIPENLVTMLISLFTNKGDMVLDPFLGSGTTAVVCEKLGRKWIGIEIKKEYCEMAKKRIMKNLIQLNLKY